MTRASVMQRPVSRGGRSSKISPPTGYVPAAVPGKTNSSGKRVPKRGDDRVKNMKCSVCGHIYDPVKGDEGIQPGTDFRDVPAAWVCPVCGAAKDKFQEMT